MEFGPILQVKNKKTGEIKYVCPKDKAFLKETKIPRKWLCPRCFMLWDLTPFYEEEKKTIEEPVKLPEKITEDDLQEFALIIHEAGLTKAWNTPLDLTEKGRDFFDSIHDQVREDLKAKGYDPDELERKIQETLKKHRKDGETPS